MNRRQATLMLAATLLAGTAQAQTAWKPTDRINYIVGVAPGGTVDLYARGIKDTLDTLKLVNGQTILVENKVGAGGALAMTPGGFRAWWGWAGRGRRVPGRRPFRSW